MRFISGLCIASACALGLLQPVEAQSPQSARARTVAEIDESVRCNLATTYRLAARQELNVRAEPRVKSSVVARLQEGRIVYVCNENGGWLNVYFGGEGPCFRTYEGGLRLREARKCRSGWVPRDWVNILSG